MKYVNLLVIDLEGFYLRSKLIGLLQLEYRVHTGEKQFQCETCKKSFSHQFYLKRHSKVHSDDNLPVGKNLRRSGQQQQNENSCHQQSQKEKRIKSHSVNGTYVYKPTTKKRKKQENEFVKDPLTGRKVQKDESYYCYHCFITSRLKVLTLPKEKLLAM